MALVTDVERYPDFIPVMTALRKTRDLPDGFEAEAMVNFKGIAETFDSRIIMDPDKRSVVVSKARKGGPVKTLENRWRFHELSDGSTLVDFYVDVRLAFPLETLLRQKFDKAKTVIRELFIAQAAENCAIVGDAKTLDLMVEAQQLGLADRLA
jgi:coenzyme Q-binding protein COQ10